MRQEEKAVRYDFLMTVILRRIVFGFSFDCSHSILALEFDSCSGLRAPEKSLVMDLSIVLYTTTEMSLFTVFS